MDIGLLGAWDFLLTYNFWSVWIALLVVFLAGLGGGVINALMTDNGFVSPKYEEANGTKILRPGYLGNMLIGGVAASISWGLYGAASNATLVPLRMITPNMEEVTNEAAEAAATRASQALATESEKETTRVVTVEATKAATAQATKVAADVAAKTGDLTLAGLVGGVLVGIAGARWLTSEVDKSLLRAAATQAAQLQKNDVLAATLATASPARALEQVRRAERTATGSQAETTGATSRDEG